MTTSLSKQIVVVLGAGPGIGFSVARKFSALGHPVALLARSLDKLEELAGQLNANDKGGRAKAYAVDATDEQGLRSTVAQVEKDFSSGSVGEAHRGARIHTGVFNPNGGMSRKPFLELTTADIKEAYQIQVIGGFVFAQAILQAISAHPEAASVNPNEAVGNLLFSGATASVKGSALFASFSASKFALRSLSQSLAREWGPKGVHVSHFVIDGIVVTERTDRWLGTNYEPNARMNPDDIAQVYLDTARQPRSVWAFEVDLRPSVEKW